MENLDYTPAYVHALQDALIWCSAASDFQPGGQAHEGWMKVCQPHLEGVSLKVCNPFEEQVVDLNPGGCVEQVHETTPIDPRFVRVIGDGEAPCEDQAACDCCIVNELDLRDNFIALARPLIKWLNDNYHPHACIHITTTHAEVLEGAIGYPTEEFLRD